MTKHIVSFSGGKDSTAMLLMMIEKGMQIDDIVFCDTGKEFPAMYEHIEKVQQKINIPITTLKAKKSFDYYMFDHIKTKGKNKGEKGRGWATINIRWCTGLLKEDVKDKYLRKYKNEEIIQYVGIAYDEPKRIKNKKYPLNEWEITEKQALEYCYSKGYDWNGLYKQFKRVSCWCCPLKSIEELKSLYQYHNPLWNELKEMDKKSYNKFRLDYTLDELEQRFEREIFLEKNQLTIFNYREV